MGVHEAVFLSQPKSSESPRLLVESEIRMMGQTQERKELMIPESNENRDLDELPRTNDIIDCVGYGYE